MDNASKNATDMIQRLQMQYNRGRQAAITNELVDIITGKLLFFSVCHVRNEDIFQVPALSSIDRQHIIRSFLSINRSLEKYHSVKPRICPSLASKRREQENERHCGSEGPLSVNRLIVAFQTTILTALIKSLHSAVIL